MKVHISNSSELHILLSASTLLTLTPSSSSRPSAVQTHMKRAWNILPVVTAEVTKREVSDLHRTKWAAVIWAVSAWVDVCVHFSSNRSYEVAGIASSEAVPSYTSGNTGLWQSEVKICLLYSCSSAEIAQICVSQSSIWSALRSHALWPSP